ncbi:MAG TPA: DUF192 domain-containing protein [Thermoanaerobaculia bacterium]|nr:DUF192 domain-containing protein [Thermoanaerobaculia bacterium]
MDFKRRANLEKNPKSKIQNPKLFLLPALVLAAACGAAPKGSPGPTPAASGPRAVMPSGAIYRLELARTPEEQQLGLMFRESLPERAGMIFLFNDGGAHPFWMKNTMIPLDMIWLDPDGKVLFVSANTPPCKADPCPSYGPTIPAANVLEIAGGMAKKEKIEVGSMLKFLDLK